MPAAEREPTAGLSAHVTAVFDAPFTVAVNFLVWAVVRAAVSGVKEILTDAAATAGSAIASRQSHRPLLCVTVICFEL